MQIQFSSAMFVIVIATYAGKTNAAMTLKQIDQSFAMFKKSCSEKVGVNVALVEGLHRGEWPETEKELKCFTLCVAESAGTLTKKKELSEKKVMQQITTQLPVDLRDRAIRTLEHCKDVSKGYKDPCDKMFYSTKCMYDFDPANFLYP